MANENRLKENVAAHLRLPLHRAPFYFAPHFLATPGMWREKFVQRANSIIEQTSAAKDEQPIFDEYKKYVLRARFQQLEFYVDALAGCFSVFEIDDTDIDDDFGDVWCSGPISSPSIIIEENRRGETIPCRLKEEIKKFIIPLAEGLRSFMKSSFREAIADGYAAIEVKYDSVSSPFVPVFLNELPNFRRRERDHEWFHLTYCDNELDDGETTSGEHYFSLCVVPTTLGIDAQMTLPVADVQAPPVANVPFDEALLDREVRRKGRPTKDWQKVIPAIEDFTRNGIKRHGSISSRNYMGFTKNVWCTERIILKAQDICQKEFGHEPSKSSIQKNVLPVLKRKGLLD